MVIWVGFSMGDRGYLWSQCSSRQAGFACSSNQRGEPQLRGGSDGAGTGLDNRWLGTTWAPPKRPPRAFATNGSGKKPLFASAIRWVSSFLLIATPRFPAASSNSPAQPQSHRLFTPALRRVNQPSHGQGQLARRPHLDRNLVGRAADASRFDLHRRLHAVDRLLEDGHRILLATALLDRVQSVVENAFGDGLLTVLHEDVDELAHQLRVIQRVGQDLALRDFTASRHRSSSSDSALGALGAVLGAPPATVVDADGIQSAAKSRGNGRRAGPSPGLRG